MKDPKPMGRRAFLGACGGAGAGLLSGCTDWMSSETSGTETGEESLRRDIEPEFKTDGKAVELLDSRVDSESITYTDALTVTAVLGNVGDDPIENTDPIADSHVGIQFTETDQSFEHHKQRDGTQIELKPGETTVKTFGPFEAVASGEWTVVAADNIEYVAPDAKTTFEVLPKTVSIGQSVSVLPEVTMTPKQFHLRDTFLSQYESWEREEAESLVRLSMAPDNQRFAIPMVSIQSDAWSPIHVQEKPQFPYQLGRRQFSITPRTRERRLGTRPPSTPFIRGSPLKAHTITEGETVMAWFRGLVDATEPEDVALEFRQVPDTGPPEAIFELPDTRYPEFEFVDFSTPDRFVEGRQSFEVTVRNVADVAGNFHGLIQYNEDGGEELFNPPRGYGLRKPIAAGGEETITIKYDHEPGTRYRLLPFNVQAEV